ncbi:ABC transporter permease [Dyadobacter aurulentus]|uniref:ABC transporter permease n=1 Tax=Dyadobacter sp. UC 10 TaxID=2605428 RepID=UPI0011F37E50|nr:ABC transporter permease [Dyadobacter sp. UC 10]KAA0989592.1 FtsX-like permease family protein [Dyadobacter sp. UC 10]
MLSNYLKITFRNLLRAKGYALINITGLAVGMAASVLIFLWIKSELQFDRVYRKADRLYQVYNRDVFNDEPTVWGSTPAPLAPALKASYADIEQATRYVPLTLLLSAQNKSVNMQGAFADPGFLQMFDLPVLAGNANSALSAPDGIIITKKLAENFFGTVDAVGKPIQVERKDNFVVAAVLEDLPHNSQFADRTYFLPWDYFKKMGVPSDDWTANNYTTFVTLKENASEAVINKKISKLSARYLKGTIENVDHREIFLHPASKWHLFSKIENGQLVGGGIVNVRLFGIIAAFILFIACVNFVNLSTARSEKRAKEVGVRKVAGATRKMLIFQFVGESVMLAAVAGCIAGLLIFALLPAFNNLVGKRLDVDLNTPYFWSTSISFVLFTGLLAGSYPAFFLSGFQPAKVVKGNVKPERDFFSPRKGLVVIQFTFAIILIISTLVIKKQISHAENRDSGFNRDHLLFTVLSGDLEKHYHALKEELINSDVAVSVTKSLGPATSLNARQWGVSWPGSVESDKNVEFDLFGADQHFVKTTGVKMLKGREVDIARYPSDSNAIVLNETAVKAMRLQEPIGGIVNFQQKDWRIVGVVKDFIFESPYSPVKPVIIAGPGGVMPFQWVSIRLNSRNPIAQNLKSSEAIFKKYNPGYPFEYAFADDTYKARFAQEQLTGTLTGIFTTLAILISCLGLFGLATFTTQQRTREIGVRKVLGASVASVVKLLTGDFLKLIVISFLIAAPIGWYIMEKWLGDFDYRITIGPGIFILAILCCTLVVILSVSFQSIKAALANPVKSLE